MKIKTGAKIYFLGIGGTGMGSVAGLAKDAGYIVSGSDTGIYPPMSTLLEELEIPVLTPYSPANIDRADPDLVIIANALSRGNPELEHVLEKAIAYTSFPKFLGDNFLSNRTSVVISGTHGKTTTTALLAHVLNELNQDPGFLIGGLPRNFPLSFNLGRGPVFVIEGDEYDTAFFDKNSKFLHYKPKHLVFNNLEFDHADIFQSLEAIEAQFVELFKLVANPKNIIANIDDANVASLLKRHNLLEQVTKVSTLGHLDKAEIRTLNAAPHPNVKNKWTANIYTSKWGELSFCTALSGKHNIANIAQVLGCLHTLASEGAINSSITARQIEEALESFKGVARRLDHLGEIDGIDVYEDFAHHPTAVRLVIESFRKSFPERRVLVAFEPRNATSRRNVFMQHFAASLALADKVYIGKCQIDERIPANQRMDVGELKKLIGDRAESFVENQHLLDCLSEEAKFGDAIIFMSSGSFSGIQYKLPKILTKISLFKTQERT